MIALISGLNMRYRNFLIFFTRLISGLSVVSLLSGLLSSAVHASDGSGLQTAVAVDIFGQAGTPREGKADRLEVREAELILFAPIDPLFDGQLNMAAHQESGVALFEVHEAYLSSSKLIARSRLRLGQFFLGIGRLNQFHRHDWPFVSAPKVQREFFDKEGVNDSGLEWSYLLPLPFFLDLTGGLTSGWTFGHAHSEGQRPLIPTHYLRAATYLELPGDGGAQLGLNYLGRKAANETQQRYLGLDATAKWREGRTLKFLFQSEIWLRALTPGGGETEDTLGAYMFPQYGFDPSLQFGVRADYFSVLNQKNAVGGSVSNSTIALIPSLTYKASEFSTLRASYTREWVSQQGAETQASDLIELQATFILGAHPAHDF